MTTQPEDDWRKDEEFISWTMKRTQMMREEVIACDCWSSTWEPWSAGKESTQLPTLKVWGDEKPKSGTYFIAYGRYDEDPSLCKMEDSGPEQSPFNWRVADDSVYGGGGGYMESDLVFADETRWHHLVTRTPNWQAIVAKMINDGVKL